tara:strand:- start:8847 stop:9347 length:501 start_codon:yes stop_codon:yes gene_type:complete
MKEVNITTAVLLAIKSFNNDPFSIYDITKEIRSCVDEDYTIFGLSSNVPHDIVRLIFTELLENDLLNNYDVRDDAGGYMVFSLSEVSNQTPVGSTFFLDLGKGMSLGDQSLILNYVSKHGPVTMKKIQSRMKGAKYTCQDINDFLSSVGKLPVGDQNVSVSKTVSL